LKATFNSLFSGAKPCAQKAGGRSLYKIFRQL
jgi:hypothetical protein